MPVRTALQVKEERIPARVVRRQPPPAHLGAGGGPRSLVLDLTTCSLSGAG